MFNALSEAGRIIGGIIEASGVSIIVVGIAYAAFSALRNRRHDNRGELLGRFRHDIGQTMLLGLDFLVAGDIIRTVTVSHSISGVASLGLVVLIRTLLVFTIHLEVEGRWPWQAKPGRDKTKAEYDL